MCERRRNLGRIAPVSSRRWLIRGTIAFLALTALPFGAFAADVVNGKAIAKRWCADCHLVSRDQAQANSDVPSFAAIAHKKEPPEKLKSFLVSPHPNMSDMNLSRSDVADLIAYIASLNQ